MTHTGHVPVAQGALPLTNGNGTLQVPHEPAAAPDAVSEEVKLTEREMADTLLRLVKRFSQERPEPAPPKTPRKRLSRAKYDALIAKETAAPRSASAVLDAVKAAHPSAIKHPPRDLMRRIKIALLARRLNALGATFREVAVLMATT
jgi:hypothetical protein